MKMEENKEKQLTVSVYLNSFELQVTFTISLHFIDTYRRKRLLYTSAAVVFKLEGIANDTQ
jgi:hypothetical protein